MISKPLAIAYKPFKSMKTNMSKERSFYTQGRRFAARILFILWLFASVSLESILATPPQLLDLPKVRQALKDHYKKYFSEIPSFFPEDPKTPIGQIECHLMLLEQVKVKEALPAGNENQLMAIHERIEWQKRPIALCDLFKHRSIKPDGPIEEISKVLLIGEAGTGKTTLSHKIAHDWAQGHWGAGFTAVYLLPVCALQQGRYNGGTPQAAPTLATAIVRECFPAECWEEHEDFKRLRTQVNEELQEPTTLVILDGLDERAGACKQLVSRAQDKEARYKLLMLSRPYGVVDERQMIQLEVEHQGFDDRQMSSYVQYYFDKCAQELQSPAATLSAELLRFIKEYPAPKAISHVPVNLAILCALRLTAPESVRAATMQGSLPRLYRRLTSHIWDRFLARWYANNPRDQYWPANEQCRHKVFSALGKIALSSLEEGLVQISDDQVLISGNKVRAILEESGITVELLKASGFLFLRSAGQEQYQFPHLTFQEYFAGRTLAQQFLSKDEDERKKVSDFLSKHKYESQYDQTLSFMAGEVSKIEEVQDIKKLLKLLGESNQELVGLQHLLLQLRVVHEWLCVAKKKVAQGMKELEEEFHMLSSLKKWFERAFAHVRLEGYRGEYLPGRRLLGLLKSSLQTFGSIASHAPELLELFKKTVQQHQGPIGAVRLAAVSSLGGALASAHEEVRTILQTMADDLHESWEIKQAARETLSQAQGTESTQEETAVGGGTAQGSLEGVRESASQSPEALLAQLRQAVTKYDESIIKDDKALRSARGSLVQAVAAATQEEFRALLDLLLPAAQDQHGFVRASAQETLLKAPLDALLDRYWSRSDNKLIPYIVPRLYHTPLVIRKDAQQVILYAAAGQVRKWSRQRQEVLADFERHVQDEISQLSHLESKLQARIDKSVWEQYFGAVGEEPSLPLAIREMMDSPCPFWEGRKVKDTHLLVLIPSHVAGKPLTLDYLGELIKSPQEGGHRTQYSDYKDSLREAIENRSIDSSYWVLMTRDVLPESTYKSYDEQCALVADHAKRTGLPYEVPEVLEAAVVVLLHHARSGERLYSDSPYTYTRCRKNATKDLQLAVGPFSEEKGFGIACFISCTGRFDSSCIVGVAGLRKV